MPTLPTDIVAGQAGHVGHSNELHAAFNASSGAVDFVKRYDPPGIVGGTDETARLQAAIDDNVGPTIDLGGTYDISAPLILPTGTRLSRGVIRAMSTFDFTATVNDGGDAQGDGVAMLMEQNGGFIYSMGRLFLDRVTVSGMNRTGSRGILAALQQPSQWDRVRVEKCLDYGVKLKGQQVAFYNMMVIDNPGIGVLLDDFSFGRFFAFNAESNGVGLQGVGIDTEFYGGHYEVNTYDFRLTGGNHWLFCGARHTTTGTRISYQIDSAAKMGYRIIRAHSAEATNAGVAIVDVARGRTHRWWEDFRGVIHDVDMMHTPSSTSFTNPLGHIIESQDGRRVRFGGRYAPTMGIEAGSGVSGQPLVEYLDSTLTRRFNVDKTANAVLGVFSTATRPVAGSVPAGTVIINSDTNALNVHSGGIWRDAMGIAI